MTRRLLSAALLAALSAFPALAEPLRFETPEAAVEAVVDALRARDRGGLIAVFGSENEDLVLSGDPERDREDWGGFLESHDVLSRVAVQEDGTARLYVGRGQWPFPVPLVEGEGGWAFDAAAARDELLARRIGRNELDVIELARRYVAAQTRFRATDWDGDGVMEFAAHVISAEGTRDGLYWPPTPEGPESPIGDFMARAAAEGYDVDGAEAEPEPWLGYYYRILTAQAEAAPGGAMDYIVNGHMVAGHALLAVPAAWGDTGVMSFMVSENGEVLEADLGEDTLARAAAIEAFDPGPDWTPVED